MKATIERATLIHAERLERRRLDQEHPALQSHDAAAVGGAHGQRKQAVAQPLQVDADALVLLLLLTLLRLLNRLLVGLRLQRVGLVLAQQHRVELLGVHEVHGKLEVSRGQLEVAR